MIRVLIADDSALVREALKVIIEPDPEIRIIGWAKDGRECVDLAEKLKPDIITMDIHMPVMNGFDATKIIMKKFPTSILVVSSIVKDDLNFTFDALNAGAVDVIEKPKIISGTALDETGKGIIQRIKKITKVRPRGKAGMAVFANRIEEKQKVPSRTDEERLLIIGTSIGGPATLNFILKTIPSDFPCPIIIVQHIASGFLDGLITWLRQSCRLKIKTGENNENLSKGSIYFAPDHYHLGITKNHKFFFSNDPPICGHRPSIDFLMTSAASVYKDRCLGIILTGMGRDGAQGLKTIRGKGGLTISQGEENCVIFAMPKAAIDSGAAVKVCPIEKIPIEISLWAKYHNSDKQKLLNIEH